MDTGRVELKFIPPLLMMGVIFVFSSIPGVADKGGAKLWAELDPQLQNSLHIPLFGMLQWLWLRAFAQPGRTRQKIVLTCFGITAVYGFFDEFHQSFVPGRFASPWDILLNLVGIVAGTLIFLGLDTNATRCLHEEKE